MRRILTPFLMLCLTGLTARLGYQIARSPVLPQFAKDLGAAPELIGLILGASTITGVFIKLPAGALSDVLGRRRMLLLGGLFFAVPPFLYLAISNPYLLLSLRFLHGFATAVFSPVASAAVADLFDRNRGERLGWFASFNEMGSAIAPVVGGLLLTATHNDYQVIYLIIGAIGVVTLLLVLLLPVGMPTGAQATLPEGQRRRQFTRGIAEVVSNRSILVASGAESAMFFGVGALVGFLPLYATQKAGLNNSQVGVILGAQLIVAMGSKPLTGRLSDRLGRKPLILAGLLLCTAVLPLIPLTRSLTLLTAEGALFGLGMAIVTPSTTALVTDLSKAGGYGAALGVFGTIWDVGEALGPIVAGALLGAFAASENAYAPAYALVAAVMALATVGFLLLVRDTSQKPSSKG
ncbi:MAG: MFS transporter [Chloroflexi bacterium]|nr:MFS transporter [Chloroflexota bacterium]